MENRTITANCDNGRLSDNLLSMQYDNNRTVVEFANAPTAEKYYILVYMKMHEDADPVMMSPIELTGASWTVSNIYTQIVQTVRFQLCCLDEATNHIEAHSKVFNGQISDSLEHDGTVQDVDVTELFDAYRGYINQLVVAAGAVVIDTDLDTAGAAADAKATGDAITELNGRLDSLGGGVPTEVRQAIYTLLTKGLYSDTGLTDEKAVLQSWATEVTDITISQSAISISGASTNQLTATTTPAGGLVTWSSSNPAVATVSSTGLVTGVSNGTATIMASCGGKKATCTATVTGFATLTGITAVYSGGSVYDTATLNDLKSDLVVTASYDNSTTATVTDYTLSGSLAIGTNTITASYGGFTDTFTVTVTENLGTLLYSWDFTNNNLTDSVGGLVAETTATQDAGGIKFSAADKYLVLNPSSTMSLKNKKVAIDIASMSNGGTYHSRLFSVTTASDYKTNTSADSFMWKSSNDGWYVYNGSWSTSKLAKADYPGSYFSGKTLVLTFDSSGYPTVSVDGTDLLTYDKAMAKTGYLVFGGSNTDQLYRLAPTISGVRIYEVA